MKGTYAFLSIVGILTITVILAEPQVFSKPLAEMPPTQHVVQLIETPKKVCPPRNFVQEFLAAWQKLDRWPERDVDLV
jgi:hypothetical protein